MKKKIEDYLNLYIGCQVQVADEVGKLVGGIIADADRWGILIDGAAKAKTFSSNDFKPILRPLSSMTAKEKQVLKLTSEGIIDLVQCADTVRYLLSKGFDLFNLITEGLAIDSTTIKP